MSSLLDSPLHAVSVGVDLFADTLTAQGVPVERVDWRPPLDAVDGALGRLLADPAIDAANQAAIARLLGARPLLVDVRPAAEVHPRHDPPHVPARRPADHLGAHVRPDARRGHRRGRSRGLADTPEAAAAAGRERRLQFAPCHHHDAVGPMAGCLASMPMYVVADAAGEPGPTPPSTRAWARSCATARSALKCWPACAGCATCSGRSSAPRSAAGRPARASSR